MSEQILQNILITGASGYIGGRLLKSLEPSNYHIRCLARNPEYLKPRVSVDTEIIQGDVMDRQSLSRALHSIHTAYYLIHSMGSKKDFVEQDKIAAHNFGKAASENKVKRIIYLGGLGDPDRDLSPHLRSRQEVGGILAGYGVQVIELRASIIIGSGSLSFEMVRALVERLPIMITPRWVSVKAQPIGINDVLQYLAAALALDTDENRIYEIGGADRVSYRDIMHEYARQRGYRRIMISVPVLTPRLSSLWLGLVTPVYSRIGKKLVESLRHETVVRDNKALTDFNIKPGGVREAIRLALQNEDKEFAETRWVDAMSSPGLNPPYGGIKYGNRLVDFRSLTTNKSPEAVFRVITRIGGNNGWYYANWLWKIRGFLDFLVGGVGLRRGRRHPHDIRVGDTIDCWRVEEYIPDKKLRLTAEMKLPGRAWLEFEVDRTENGTIVKQTAVFDPLGLGGLAYWYSIYPVHSIIFNGMIRCIVQHAEQKKKHEEKQ